MRQLTSSSDSFPVLRNDKFAPALLHNFGMLSQISSLIRLPVPLREAYHRISLVETKIRYFSFWASVMTRDFDRQIAELQIHAVLLSRFARLGTPHAGRMA